jgi:hypothetical protein
MDWVIIEVVIGLAFLFFVISIVSSAVYEGIAAIFKLRARALERGVVNLLTGRSQPLRQAMTAPEVDEQAPPAEGAEPQPDGQPTMTVGGLLRGVFNDPLISGYRAGQAEVDVQDVRPKLPSYLASHSFRNALFNVTDLLEATATQPPGGGDPLGAAQIRQNVEAAISGIPSAHLRNTLNTIWVSVDRDVTEFREGVERWFDRAMERVSGWYKRWAQLLLFVIGAIVALLVNADAIRIADELWSDDGVRDALVAQLGTQEPNPRAEEVLEQLDDIGFPVGWGGDKSPDGGWDIFAAISGWLITGVAVTFGAPFWFDFLGKVSNLRSAGKKPASVLPPPEPD